MELFIAFIMAGVLVYEFYNGEIIVKNGAPAQKGFRARQTQQPVGFGLSHRPLFWCSCF